MKDRNYPVILGLKDDAPDVKTSTKEEFAESLDGGCIPPSGSAIWKHWTT